MEAEISCLTPLPTLREPAPDTLLHPYRAIIEDRVVSAIASVGEEAFHAHQCVDFVQDIVAVTTIRAMTQVTEKTIRVGLTKTNWTQHQCRKDDDTNG